MRKGFAWGVLDVDGLREKILSWEAAQTSSQA